MSIVEVKVLIELPEDIKIFIIFIFYKMSNRHDINQKTDFNRWSISYLTEIFQCSKCKKRNTVFIKQSKTQNCGYCGNPNYIKK